jgi:hypothetical protein
MDHLATQIMKPDATEPAALAVPIAQPGQAAGGTGCRSQE